MVSWKWVVEQSPGFDEHPGEGFSSGTAPTGGIAVLLGWLAEDPPDGIAVFSVAGVSSSSHSSDCVDPKLLPDVPCCSAGGAPAADKGQPWVFGCSVPEAVVNVPVAAR